MCVCVRSYVGLLPASLQQLVVVVLSHRRVHVQKFGRGVLQHGQGPEGVALIQGLIDLTNGSDSCEHTHTHTNNIFFSASQVVE